jgi:hypothetical protein
MVVQPQTWLEVVQMVVVRRIAVEVVVIGRQGWARSDNIHQPHLEVVALPF